MKNVVLGIIGIVLFLCGCVSENGNMVTVKGTITGDLKGHDKIFMYTRTGEDSTIIKDGHYTFSFPFDKVEMKMFLPEYVTALHQIYRPFGILIDGPGVYKINTDITKGMHSSTVEGPEAAELYYQFNKDQEKSYKKINNKLADLYGDDWYRNMSDENLKKSRDSLQQQYLIPLIEELVKRHPHSAASTFVLAGTGRTVLNLKQQEKMYAMLSDKMKDSDEGKSFYHYIQGVKNSAIGHKVANFTLPDPQDNPVPFDQFKGKYVMLDFWASWCVPCRKSFPLMRKMYQQYKGKGFEIYSISIDESKSAWLKAVKEEQNPWSQSLDTKDIASKGFAVTAVPTAYLVSPEGKIIAKQVGFDPTGKEHGAIDQKLTELFGSLKMTSKPPEHKNKKVMKATKMISIQ